MILYITMSIIVWMCKFPLPGNIHVETLTAKWWLWEVMRSGEWRSRDEAGTLPEEMRGSAASLPPGEDTGQMGSFKPGRGLASLLVLWSSTSCLQDCGREIVVFEPLMAQLVRNPPAMQETWVWPRLGRSPGEGKGYPLQYSALENSMDCLVHGVSKTQTRLSNFHIHFQYVNKEEWHRGTSCSLTQIPLMATFCRTVVDVLECEINRAPPAWFRFLKFFVLFCSIRLCHVRDTSTTRLLNSS